METIRCLGDWILIRASSNNQYSQCGKGTVVEFSYDMEVEFTVGDTVIYNPEHTFGLTEEGENQLYLIRDSYIMAIVKEAK